MGTEQYVQHDWSNLTYILLLTGITIFVFLNMGLFLVMVSRAQKVTGAAATPVESGPGLESAPAPEALPEPPDALPAA